jgi:hypothetical protein
MSEVALIKEKLNAKARKATIQRLELEHEHQIEAIQEEKEATAHAHLTLVDLYNISQDVTKQIETLSERIDTTVENTSGRIRKLEEKMLDTIEHAVDASNEI